MTARQPRHKSLHFCQIHHDDKALSDELGRYVSEGIREGRAVVVVATDARERELRASLARTGLGEDEIARLLVTINSGELLQKFMRSGEPDKVLFFGAVSPILRSAIATGYGQPRVYGEMVNELWRNGQPAAAIQLEQLWNEILQEYECSLFCGYVLDAFDPDSYIPYLESVCATHSSIVATSSEESVRRAIDDACQHVLGIQLSRILSQSKLGGNAWHLELPLSRRAILWLKSNTPSRLTQVLHFARHAYAKQAAAGQA